ncbi:hypothetical protein D9758_005163 [Tetrapyrgos nigripes]|uniref:CFEM domain-containing protein n=1 Tax=Tetrapyrgos nigripes TaxID=182062 RepID=A0A8H5LWH4_9AGAR|nr:hypothetical protein D9758_005163 [Tetrapyrgos nigripes]
MQFTSTSIFTLFALAAALFSGASASTLRARQIPNCASVCIANADYDGCAPTDNVCLCHSQKFVSSTAECIAGACTGDDLEQANADSRQLCAAVGVTLTSSVPAPTATSPSSGSDSTSGTDSTSTDASSPTSAPDSSSSSTDNSNNGALSQGVNALAGVVAIGLAAAML